MRKLLVPLFVTALFLGACQSSVITPEERTLPETSNAFTGTSVAVDLTQSHISFLGRSNIINHEGKFGTFDVIITPDITEPANVEKAQIDVMLDAKSIVVDNEMLQAHLQKTEFFDTENFDTITFTSTSIVAKGDNKFDITGDLTVKGQTKSVTIADAEITDEYISGTFDMPRKDFSVGNDSYGDKLLDPMVPVEIKIVFQK